MIPIDQSVDERKGGYSIPPKQRRGGSKYGLVVLIYINISAMAFTLTIYTTTLHLPIMNELRKNNIIETSDQKQNFEIYLS